MYLKNLPNTEYDNIIYALQDPITLEIRYIGKSTKGIHRPKHHFYPCYYESKKMWDYPVYRWIRKLQNTCGQFPNLIFIQQFETISLQELNACEIYWIAYYRELLGKKLLNTTIGGDGSVGYKWTEEQLANFSKVRTGEKKPEGFKKAAGEWLNAGRKKLGEGFNKKVSDGTKKWWKMLPEETRKKIIGKNLTAGQKRSIKIEDQFGVIYNSISEAARVLNLDNDSIKYNMLRGKIHKGYLFKEVK